MPLCHAICRLIIDTPHTPLLRLMRRYEPLSYLRHLLYDTPEASVIACRRYFAMPRVAANTPPPQRVIDSHLLIFCCR